MKQPLVLAADKHLIEYAFVYALLIKLLWSRLQQAVELSGVLAIPPLLPEDFVPLDIKYFDNSLVLVPRERPESVTVL